jgi:hypothetical protein
VELAGAGFGEPQGDAAAFAAAWSQLLDGACLPPAGVVSTAERGAAGAPRLLGPDSAQPDEERGGPGRAASLLALLAAVLAGTALALALRAAA